MFYDSDRFDFPTRLATAREAVYREYLSIRDKMSDWVERDLYNDGWTVFGLYNFPDGEPLAENIAQCPVSAELINACFPRHGAGGFSVLQPGTQIRPHEGYQGKYLRCHLGLRVPDGDCGLRIGSQVRRWAEGEVVVFDDRVQHSAWNNTEAERVVLLVDFIPDSRKSRG